MSCEYVVIHVVAEVMAADIEVDKQVELIDAMLFDAYATVYKFIAKNIVYVEVSHEFNYKEESLLAKNVLTNLWSVLDYCCFTLYCSVCDKPPTPKIGRQLGFPYDKLDGAGAREKLTKWAKEALKLGDTKFSEFMEAFDQLRDTKFSDSAELQQQSKKIDAIDFHRLHYLRNAFTHRTMTIEETAHVKSEQLKKRGVTSPSISLAIKVPAEPWKDESQTTDTVSMLDFLMSACERVQEIRDMILSKLKQQKFEEKFEFKVTATEFTCKKKKDFKYFEKELKHLHLRCYGLDGDYDDSTSVD
jgi:hypothetical protein